MISPASKIEFRIDGISRNDDWLNPWITTTFGDFCAVNPDLDHAEIAGAIVIFGRAVVGGGAAPLVTIRRAS